MLRSFFELFSFELYSGDLFGKYAMGVMILACLFFLVFVSFRSLLFPLPEYEIIYVDNMPCVVIDDGISCDWSKWQGE